jgi:hypothetical protein
MNGKANLATLLLLAPASAPAGLAEVQIPPGWEVLQITDDPDFDDRPSINNCGQVVWSKRINQNTDQEEVFLYDIPSGSLIQITDNDFRDWNPDINDFGTIAWAHARAPGGSAHLEVALYERGTVTYLTDNEVNDNQVTINNLGQVAWTHWQDAPSCNGANVFLYDGTSIQQLSSGARYHQSPEINNVGEVAWTAFDFCTTPWISSIYLWSDGVATELTDPAQKNQAARINDLSQMCWGPGSDGIAFWDGGELEILTTWGGGSSLNNRGDIAVLRWHSSEAAWQLWWYKDGEFLQLTDTVVNDLAARINDHREIVWKRGDGLNTDMYILKPPAGDATGDGVVTVSDAALFAQNLTGPVSVAPSCFFCTSSSDSDLDGDIDLWDFSALQRSFTDTSDLGEFAPCMTGPLPSHDYCNCRFLDFDGDRDLDLEDFVALQRAADSDA